jgi:hypothetical protein
MLQILRQPESIFYKNEGSGVALQVEVGCPLGYAPPTAPLPLRMSLHYSDTLELFPSQGALVVQLREGTVGYALSAQTPTLTLDFRIEYVTQKVRSAFVVKVAPDYSALPEPPHPGMRWVGVVSTTITVKSKRPKELRAGGGAGAGADAPMSAFDHDARLQHGIGGPPLEEEERGRSRGGGAGAASQSAVAIAAAAAAAAAATYPPPPRVQHPLAITILSTLQQLLQQVDEMGGAMRRQEQLLGELTERVSQRGKGAAGAPVGPPPDAPGAAAYAQRSAALPLYSDWHGQSQQLTLQQQQQHMLLSVAYAAGFHNPSAFMGTGPFSGALAGIGGGGGGGGGGGEGGGGGGGSSSSSSSSSSSAAGAASAAGEGGAGAGAAATLSGGKRTRDP